MCFASVVTCHENVLLLYRQQLDDTGVHDPPPSVFDWLLLFAWLVSFLSHRFSSLAVNATNTQWVDGKELNLFQKKVHHLSHHLSSFIMRSTGHWVFAPVSSSSTDRWSPGINLKMCLRMLVFLLFLGRVPNREEVLVSSHEGERELLLPAKLELLERTTDWWWRREFRDHLEPSCVEKSLGKKQLSSVLLAALKGPGESASSNTLIWSLSSVATLLKLLSLEKRRPWQTVGELVEESTERWKLLSFKLPGNNKKPHVSQSSSCQEDCQQLCFSGELLSSTLCGAHHISRQSQWARFEEMTLVVRKEVLWSDSWEHTHLAAGTFPVTLVFAAPSVSRVESSVSVKNDKVLFSVSQAQPDSQNFQTILQTFCLHWFHWTVSGVNSQKFPFQPLFLWSAAKFCFLPGSCLTFMAIWSNIVTICKLNCSLSFNKES